MQILKRKWVQTSKQLLTTIQTNLKIDEIEDFGQRTPAFQKGFSEMLQLDFV